MQRLYREPRKQNFRAFRGVRIGQGLFLRPIPRRGNGTYGSPDVVGVGALVAVFWN